MSALSPSIQVPKRIYPLRPHAVHEQVKSSRARFIVIPAGRRSGKTELAKRRLVREGFAPRSKFSDPRYFAGAPTRDQAKAIYWQDLKAMVPPHLLAEKPSESHLVLSLITGAELHVLGMDKPERIEGRPWDGGVLDEYANMKARTWGEHVRPALSDRLGWAWLIGVPEGRNHYYDLNQYAKSGIDPEWASFTWRSDTVLPRSEVEAARRQLDPLVFEQEYGASFVNFAGRAYYAFDADRHARVGVVPKYDPRHPIALCFDFNVAPGVAAIVQELPLPGEYERDENGVPLLDRQIVGSVVVGQVYIPRGSNTQMVVKRILQDYAHRHRSTVHCYGDASGGADGSAKVSGSDWDLIRAGLIRGYPAEDIPGFGEDAVHMHVPAANPAVRRRINALNTRLLNGMGESHMMVDPQAAPNVVKDLEGVRTVEGGAGDLDKKSDPDLTHISDALGYYVAREFPIDSATQMTTPLRM